LSTRVDGSRCPHAASHLEDAAGRMQSRRARTDCKTGKADGSQLHFIDRFDAPQ